MEIISCIHYWVIETPNSKTSKGVCKYCGEVREFWNHIPSTTSPYYLIRGNKKGDTSTIYRRTMVPKVSRQRGL